MSVLLTLALIIGIRHAFEPDHIAAVLAASTESKSLSDSAKQGAIWGIGHTITLVLFSMILIGLQIEINESVFVMFEFFAGIVLILMGIDVLKKVKFQFTSRINDKHYAPILASNKPRPFLKILGIGLLHGAAGSGVIIAVVSTSIDSIYLKFTYIAIFSIWLIISMSLLSILMSMPLQRRIKFVPFRYFRVAAGTLAILIGLNILYQSGIQINTLHI